MAGESFVKEAAMAKLYASRVAERHCTLQLNLRARFKRAPLRPDQHVFKVQLDIHFDAPVAREEVENIFERTGEQVSQRA